MWNDIGFEDGGCARVIPFDSVEDVVIPTGASKNLSGSKRRHGS